MSYPWGRCITRPGRAHRWGVKHNDRLVIGGDLTTIHGLESLAVPYTVWLFRQKKSTGYAGCSVMFNIPGVHNHGVDHFRLEYFVDCLLHTVDLGVAQRFIGTALLLILRRNCYGSECGALLGRMNDGCRLMRQDMRLYYRKLRQERFGKQGVTKIRKFSMKSFGADLDRPCLKAKGAESRDLVDFAVDLLHRFEHVLGETGRLLVEAGESLQDFYSIIDSEQRKLDVASQQELLDSVINHLADYKACGGHMVPKHHCLMHCVLQVCKTGNPKYHSTYVDETENGIIAAVAQSVHRATMEVSIFERIEVEVYGRSARCPDLMS